MQCLFFVDRDKTKEAELMFDTQFGGWLLVMCCCYYFGIHLLMDLILFRNLKRNEVMTKKN